MTQNIIQTIIGLLLVIALFLFMAWVMRRFSQGPGLGGKHIQLLAGMSLGTKEKLLIVDACGQQLLLGVTAQQITTLHRFSDPVIDVSDTHKVSDFAQKLQAFLVKSPTIKQTNTDRNESHPESEVKRN